MLLGLGRAASHGNKMGARWLSEMKEANHEELAKEEAKPARTRTRATRRTAVRDKSRMANPAKKRRTAAAPVSQAPVSTSRRSRDQRGPTMTTQGLHKLENKEVWGLVHPQRQQRNNASGREETLFSTEDFGQGRTGAGRDGRGAAILGLGKADRAKRRLGSGAREEGRVHQQLGLSKMTLSWSLFVHHKEICSPVPGMEVTREKVRPREKVDAKVRRAS